MISCDEAMVAFDKYIWALSYRFSKKLRGCDPSDLHQEGLIKLYEVYTSAANLNKPDSELSKILKTSLVHRFIDIQREQRIQDQHLDTIDLELISRTFGCDAFEELHFQYCKEYLSGFVSPEAVRLLESLLEPTPGVMRAFNLQCMRREHIKQQGIKTLTTRKISHQLVGHTLGFSIGKTKLLIHELQQAFQEHMCSAYSYKLNKVMC